MSAPVRERVGVSAAGPAEGPKLALPARRSAAVGAGPDYGVSDVPDWREIDWDEHLREIEVRGAPIRYVEFGSGEGPPLLLVHGIAGCWQHWLENIAPLGRHRRVLAVDLPGFGSSAPMREAVSMTEYADALDALCDVLSTGPVVAVGNSMGGCISAELAIRHPSRVDRLALVDAAGISIARGRQLHLRSLVRLLAAVGTTGSVADRRMLRRPGFRHLALGGMVRHPTRLRLDLISRQVDGTGAPAFLEAMTELRACGLRERLPEIDCPTLVVFGRDDVLVPVRDAQDFARLISDSRVLIFDDTGHMPMLERPQRFNEAITAFANEIIAEA